MARQLLPTGVTAIRPITFQLDNGVLSGVVCQVDFVNGSSQAVDIFPQLTATEKANAQNLFNSIKEALTSIFV